MTIDVYLLQEISSPFPLWAPEPTPLEEFDDMVAWALVHNLAFRQEDDVVEQIERLGSRLQQGHKYGRIREMCDLLHALHDLERR